MRIQKSIFDNIDWMLIILYLVLVIFGWMNIYAAGYSEEQQGILDMSENSGKQLIWISSSLIIGFIILLVDTNFFSSFAYPIYIFMLILLAAVLLFGHEVKGATSWFKFGGGYHTAVRICKVCYLYSGCKIPEFTKGQYTKR